MVRKKLLVGLVIAGVAATAILVIFGPTWFRQYDLPAGASPSLQLPITESSNLTMIGAFFSESSPQPHSGLDFAFNKSVDIKAAAGGYVEDVKFWYNEKGGHWQTNVRVRINQQWHIEVAFESWTTTEAEGQLQANAIVVQIGMKISAGAKLGTLLWHGEGCHIDFGLGSNWVRICPYPYFDAGAKVSFDYLFAIYKKNPSATQPCN